MFPRAVALVKHFHPTCYNVFPVLKNHAHTLFSKKLFDFAPLSQNLIRSIRSGLSRADVESKVLAVCSAFDKIQTEKLTLDSHFIKDLGLDSLDHIEVIMEIENEFWFEIPDVEAEKLFTPRDVVEHVCQSMAKAAPVE